MKNLKYISFTGVDEFTSISNLEEISKTFPRVEFAVLLNLEKQGLDVRYPDGHWRRVFLHSSIRNKAIHLCGRTTLETFANTLHLHDELFGSVDSRIQLNLIPEILPDKALYFHAACKILERKSKSFITQYNQGNVPYEFLFSTLDNHSYLFDASLGAGVVPDSYSRPISGKFCGYAGGLNPENIRQQLEKIKQVVGYNPMFWIDMQAGVRTDGIFDVHKVFAVLEQIYND